MKLSAYRAVSKRCLTHYVKVLATNSLCVIGQPLLPLYAKKETEFPPNYRFPFDFSSRKEVQVFFGALLTG